MTSQWIDDARALLLIGASLWSLTLARAVLRRDARSPRRARFAITTMAAAIVLGAASWVVLFWVR